MGGHRREGIMFARIAKLIVLLLIAVGIGFLVGLLRPRRVASRSLAAADHVADLPRGLSRDTTGNESGIPT